MDTQKMYSLAKEWSDKGFQVNTHAIGDAANRIAIDVYERLLAEGNASNNDKRYRIEHAQILVRWSLLVVCHADNKLHRAKKISPELASWDLQLQCSQRTAHPTWAMENPAWVPNA